MTLTLTHSLLSYDFRISRSRGTKSRRFGNIGVAVLLRRRGGRGEDAFPKSEGGGGQLIKN